MSSQTPLKVAFVGLSTQGWATNTTGPSLIDASLKDKLTLVAVSTTSEASAAKSAKKWTEASGKEVKGYHGDISSLLNGEPGVDLVAVSIPIPKHKATLLKIIEAKKDFFVEWPAGTTAQETRDIADAAKKHGVRSVVGLQGRQTPTVKKLKEIIDSGKIGRVLSSNVISLLPREMQVFGPETKEQYSKYLENKNGGGTLLTIPVGHQLDPIIYVLGEFASVSATATTHYPTANIMDDTTGLPTGKALPAMGDDHVSITGVLQSGALINSFWRAGPKFSTGGRIVFLWEIDGEEGSIRLQSSKGNLMGAFTNMQEPELFVNGERVEIEGRDSPAAILTPLIGNWAEFAKGKEGTHATIEDAVKVKNVIEAIEKSMVTGERVTIV